MIRLYDVVVVGGAVAGEFVRCPWLGIALLKAREDVGRGGSEAGIASHRLLDGTPA
ncbi:MULTISPECIES: hypothetical protein [Streptomyces]|uniref:hypothetical protein n=1 Tax=Streptomyces TaxID=1883 RepID=UPI001489E2A2|nr:MULTISPECIES: hypothetical protein [Streptomyces]